MAGRDSVRSLHLPGLLLPVCTAAFETVALGMVVFGCALSPAEMAPPGRPSPRPASASDGAAPDVQIVIDVPRSADDGAGLGMASRYSLMRAHDGGDVFVPFSFRELEGPDRRTLRFADTSTLAGHRYRYRAWALAEQERPTFGNAGAMPSPSPASAWVEVRGGGPEEPGADATLGPAPALQLGDPELADGETLRLSFRTSADDRAGRVRSYVIIRAQAGGAFVPFSGGAIDARGDGKEPAELEVTTLAPPGAGARYQLYMLPNRGEATSSPPTELRKPGTSFFNRKRLNVALLLGVTTALALLFLFQAQRGAKMFIRRIPGVDAIEEAIGRATEMGRPILYVPGIDELQNIQTIASMLILGRVAETVAEYDSEIRVPCCIPLVAAVSEEVVRQGFYDAGRPDAHRPQNIQWISSEQFAFCAGTNGIMLRDQPATNLFLGRFFAESLILAETGYVNRAIQIAGTAEITQLPFFIAACDYTLIGEELFAVSAYLTGEPRLLSTLKAADYIKGLCILMLVAGSVAALIAPDSFFLNWLVAFLDPGA